MSEIEGSERSRRSVHARGILRAARRAITLTPERFGDRETYVARAEFLPLAMLADKADNWIHGAD